MFTGKEGNNSKPSAIEEHVAKPEINPVPKQKHFEGGECQREWDNAGREEARHTGRDGSPLNYCVRTYTRN